MSEITESLIGSTDDNTKPCKYPSCTNRMPLASNSDYCEVCRCLAIRNAIALTLDPTAPFMDRHEHVFQSMLHLLKPDEIILGTEKIERAYMDFQKAIKAHQLESHRAARHQFILEDMDHHRSQSKTPKTKSKRAKKADKLADMFGSVDAAKEVMGGEYDDM